MVFILIAMYVRRTVFLERSTPLRICTRCHDVIVQGGTEKCPCGGDLNDADLWTRDG